MNTLTIILFTASIVAVLCEHSDDSAAANRTPCTVCEDCSYHETCHESKCVDICQLRDGEIVKSKCGVNAYCYQTGAHQATCRCYEDHSGDPFVKCNQGTVGIVDDIWKDYPAISKHRFDQPNSLSKEPDQLI